MRDVSLPRAGASLALCFALVLALFTNSNHALRTTPDKSIGSFRNSINRENNHHGKSNYVDRDETSRAGSSRSTDTPATNEPLFNSLFWDEGIDVTRFHTCLKAELARIMAGLAEGDEEEEDERRSTSSRKKKKTTSSFSSPLAKKPTPSSPTALIVGVEYGTEVIELAQAGYDVLGIEPFPEYVAHVVDAAARADVLDKINVYSAGAGAERGNMSITYYQGSVTTPIVRLDDVVKGRTVDVLSIDVHGGATNYDVLSGGKESLKNGLFKSIWCELYSETGPAGGIADWGIKLLDLLKQHDYVMYDFQWSGGAKSCELQGIPAHLCGELKTHEGARPLDSARAYLETMHRILETDFQYLQTDFVAVPRALAERVEPAFRKVSARCKQG